MTTHHRKFIRPGDLLPGDFIHGSERIVYSVRRESYRGKLRVYFTDGTSGDYSVDATLSVRRRGSTLERY